MLRDGYRPTHSDELVEKCCFQIGTVTNIDVVLGHIAVEVGISNELAELVFTFGTYVG